MTCLMEELVTGLDFRRKGVCEGSILQAQMYSLCLCHCHVSSVLPTKSTWDWGAFELVCPYQWCSHVMLVKSWLKCFHGIL